MLFEPVGKEIDARTNICVVVLLCASAALFAFARFHGPSSPKPVHVYEVRIYQFQEGKMAALKAGLGERMEAIFRHHKIESIDRWSPEAAPDSQDLIVCLLERASRQEAKKSWIAFEADPEWQKLKADCEINGPLVDHYFMNPTSFSALR